MSMSKDSANQPRISVNELAKFINAKAARQRAILRDQKFPGEFKGMYYKESTQAISTCIASNLENTSVLDRAVQALEQQTPDKIGTQRRLDSNIDAIQTFSAMLDEIDLKGATPSLGPNVASPLMIRNVRVSVRPEILLKGTGKSKIDLVGGLKLHFSRTNSLGDDGAGYVSAVLQEHAKTHQANDGDAFGPYCCVVDVGRQMMCPGVKAVINRMKDVEAACTNIFALWPSITKDD
jgi:hypothetical protein